jgi:hypothetical protein
VEIVAHDQLLGDHFDPIHKRIVLSRENFHGTSVAALGVAAHECGHAIQHREAYAPLQWRMASVGLTTFASQIVLWLPLLGMFTGFLNTGMALVLMASAWGILMLFNLITLPVEFDASARARLVLIRLVRRLLPVSDSYHGARFTVLRKGRRLLTPLTLVLIMIEITDVLFAVDSIPATFGITRDPFIVYTSNVCAILGLRSLYFLLAVSLTGLSI